MLSTTSELFDNTQYTEFDINYYFSFFFTMTLPSHFCSTMKWIQIDKRQEVVVLRLLRIPWEIFLLIYRNQQWKSTKWTARQYKIKSRPINIITKKKHIRGWELKEWNTQYVLKIDNFNNENSQFSSI